jgi:hypothetical protein
MRRGAVGLGVALTFVGPAEALASNCLASNDPFVRFASQGGTDTLREDIEKDLAAELARDGVRLCQEGSTAEGRAPLATVSVSIEARAAEIRVEDAVTSKVVSRRVEVPEGPPDVVALTIALATDELLRASWAELAFSKLRPAPPPAPAPAPVRPPPEPAPLPPPAHRSNELGARAVVAWYSGGQTHFGGEAFYRRELLSWLDAEISASARGGLPADAPHGTIDALAFGGGVAVGLWPFAVSSWRFGAVTGVDVAYVSLRGRARPGAVDDDLEGVTSTLRGGLATTVDLEPVRLSAEVAAGGPLVGLEALDDETVVTGVTGVLVRTHLGLGAPF